MNHLLPFLNTRALASAYMLANIPEYLYQKYRAEESVFLLAKQFTADQLVAEFQHILTSQETQEYDTITIYAIAIVLTFKKYDEAKPFFDRFRLTNIPWATQISDLFEKGARAEYEVDSSGNTEITLTQLSPSANVVIPVPMGSNQKIAHFYQ
jgi:hypothetical protein